MLSFAVDIVVALLKHQVKAGVGDNALNAFLEQLADCSGKELRSKLKHLHRSEHLAAELLAAAEETERCFEHKSGLRARRSAQRILPITGAEALQPILTRLPETTDEVEFNSAISD